jgi:hypothetical protein
MHHTLTMPRTWIVIELVLAYVLFSPATFSQQCYYPDGSHIPAVEPSEGGPWETPCNASLRGQSACCNRYRRGCTDSSFTPAPCAKRCLKGELIIAVQSIMAQLIELARTSERGLVFEPHLLRLGHRWCILVLRLWRRFLLRPARCSVYCEQYLGQAVVLSWQLELFCSEGQ